MTFSRPIILFAMANDAQYALRLAEEERSVREELRDAHDDQRIEFYSLGHTTVDDIFATLNRFHDRMAVFHYSGHSDGEYLRLEGGDASDDSISALLGMEQQLRLVFLNGCANYRQLDELFSQGVRAVIATSAPIDDDKALHFSSQFYHALAAGKTIREAFDTAASYLQNRQPDFLAVTRSFQLRPEDREENRFPWGLYTQHPVDADWHLPTPEQMAETIPRNQAKMGPADLQLQETVQRPGAASENLGALRGVELETHDRRVQNSQGVFRLASDTLLGRGPDCDIVVLDPNVSRRHARILCRPEGVFLEDQNSSNGTFWNDTRISRIPITEAGTLRLDQVEFQVRILRND